MTHFGQRDPQAQVDSEPFVHMRISDTSLLNRLEGRSPCPRCGKSRKYFCYTCYVPIAELNGKLPHVKLPIKIDIIKHKNEIDGKSTACHAAILAHQDVTIHTFPDVPSYDDDDERVVLIFPSVHARTVTQLINDQHSTVPLDLPKGHHRGTLIKNFNEEAVALADTFQPLTNRLPVDRAVFIDSTWNQSRGIYKDKRIKKLPCVVVQNRISQFWRHQKGSPRWYLATIEAIHQFLIEVHASAWGVSDTYAIDRADCRFLSKYVVEQKSIRAAQQPYDGQYDNLLFFFKHMYDLIHAYYDHEQLYAYKRRLL